MNDQRFVLKALVGGELVFCLGGKTERALITKAAAYPPLIQERLRIIDTTTGLTVWAATRSLA